MNKRILTLVLALVMVLSLGLTAFAAPEAEDEKITNPKVQWLIDKGIVVGRLQEDGKTKVFDLDKTITREEVTKMVIFHRGSEPLARALQSTKGIFTDVAIDRWSNGYINAAQVENLVRGYEDRSFKPEGDITYAEIAAILVRLNPKWTAADEKAAIWPVSFMKAAEDFGILRGVEIKDANEKAVREKVFEMMYNAFDGKYQAPVANDKLGVVSRVWGDAIELNGSEEYKVTKSTIFVQRSLGSLYYAKDFYGALVRINLNKDNEITHMVLLGNDKVAEPIGRWLGIAEAGVISGDLASAKNEEVVFVGGEKLVTNDHTRYFVSDKDKENFFEAKKLSDAIDATNADHLKGVYAAYDVQKVTGVKYARVIVFSAGKEGKRDKALRRLVTDIKSNFKATVEDTNAAESEMDFGRYNAFPYNYKATRMDVVNFKYVDKDSVRDAGIVIDYETANVYEVTKIGDIRYQNDGTVRFVGDAITLKDVKGSTQEFALSLDGVSVFTNGLGKGAHVQVAFSDDDARVIDVISKVDLGLRGYLENGVPANQVCGIAVDREERLDGELDVAVRVKVDGQIKIYRILKSEIKAIFGPEADYAEILKNIKDVSICGLVEKSNGARLDLLHSITLDREFVAKYNACGREAIQLTKDVKDFVAANFDESAKDVFKKEVKDDKTALATAIEKGQKLVDQGKKECVALFLDEDTKTSLENIDKAIKDATKAPAESQEVKDQKAAAALMAKVKEAAKDEKVCPKDDAAVKEVVKKAVGDAEFDKMQNLTAEKGTQTFDECYYTISFDYGEATGNSDAVYFTK